MGYRVDYTLLDAMYEQLNNQVEAWDSELNAAKTAVERLIATNNMSGVGADAVRNYLKEVHAPLVESLIALINLHKTNFILYKTDYQQSIDTGFDTVIDEEELSGIVQALGVMKNAAIEVDEEARAILRQIEDIFVTSFRSVTDVADVLGKASDKCLTLSQKIIELESKHSRDLFTKTESAIDILTNTINTYLNQGRSFKANYDPNSSVNANSNYRLTMLSSILISDLDGKAEAAQTAVEYHESRKELEKRIEIAKWEKLLVTGAVVIASAIAIVALPVSGPLVAGLVNGVSSAIIGANNKAMDLYVVDGDLSGEDWAQVVVEGSKGYLTGLATGVVGGVAGKAISGLTHGIPALQSGNMVVNTATHIAVGSVTDVTTGIVTRATGEVVEQLVDDKEGVNWSEVGTKAFDGGEMIKDGVIGGVGGYYEGHKVDYSDSMYSDYEQGTLDDMYAKGELEYSVDPELDGADYLPSEELNYDMTPKKESSFIEDYIVKNKDDNLTWKERITPDNIISPDDYSHSKHDIINGVNDVLEEGYKTLDDAKLVNETWEGGHDSKFKSNDEILHEINQASEGGAFHPGGGEGGGGIR